MHAVLNILIGSLCLAEGLALALDRMLPLGFAYVCFGFGYYALAVSFAHGAYTP